MSFAIDMEKSPFIIRRADATQPTARVQYTINNQGQILNAVFTTADPDEAKQIAELVENHNREVRLRSAISQ